jgi:hypothetical protein
MLSPPAYSRSPERREMSVPPALPANPPAVIVFAHEPLPDAPADATTRVSIDQTSLLYVANRSGAFRLIARTIDRVVAAAEHEIHRAAAGTVVLSPALAPGARRLYFEPNDRRPTVAGREDTDVWFVERTVQGWGVPQPLGAPFDTPYNEHSPTTDAAGTLCFNSGRPDSEENDIYCGKVGDSSPPERQSLLNSPAEDATPWLSGDGNLIVFTSNRRGGLGGWDVYVSRKVGGSWSAPRKLGAPINSSADEVAVSLSVAGDYLHFCRPANAAGPRRLTGARTPAARCPVRRRTAGSRSSRRPCRRR